MPGDDGLRAFWNKLVLLTAALIAIVGSGVPATAQAVQQSGSVTGYHVPTWFSSGFQADGGSPDSPFVNSLGIFGGSDCPVGISSQTSPGVSVLPYSILTLCQSPSTTTFKVEGVNGQATPSVVFNIGGVDYPFPGPGTGTVVGPVTSAVGNLACWNNTTGTLAKDCGQPTAYPLGVANNISSQHLSAAIAAGQAAFATSGYYAAGDYGAATYTYNSGAATPCGLTDADGNNFSLNVSTVMPEMCGAQRDDGSASAFDSYAAVLAAYNYGRPMVFPESLYLSQAFGISKPVNWFGSPALQSINSTTSYYVTLRFPTGYSGLVVLRANQSINAQGDVSLTGGPATGGDTSIFSGLRVQIGTGARPTTTVNNRAAIQTRARSKWSSIATVGADGDGFFVNTSGSVGNANDMSVDGLVVQNAWGNGFQVGGNNANAGIFKGINVNGVGKAGIADVSTLGNAYLGNQVTNNGIMSSVIKSNNRYDAIAISTNQDPTSTTGYWQLRGAVVAADTWDPAATYYPGGAYYTTGGSNTSTFVNPYSEAGFPPSSFQSASGGARIVTVTGGQLGGLVDTTNGDYTGINRGTLRATTVYALSPSTTKVVFEAQSTGSGAAVFARLWNKTATSYSTRGAALAFAGGYRADGTTAWDAGAIYGIPLGASDASNGQTVIRAWNGGTAALTDIALFRPTGILPATDNTYPDGSTSLRYSGNYSVSYHPGAGTATWTTNSGSPESNLTSAIGGIAADSAGGGLYYKATGTGNTGWVKQVSVGAATSSGLTMATARLLGRTTASTGAIEEISVGSNLTLSGGTLTLTKPILSGTTGSIGGGAITAGTCATGTATVTGATTSMAAVASPVTDPGDPYFVRAYVSAADTVTVKVCTNLAAGGTPTASAYNVRVLQ